VCRKMAAGILAVRRGHFSSATQEAWGYPPSQQIIGEKSGLKPSFSGVD